MYGTIEEDLGMTLFRTLFFIFLFISFIFFVFMWYFLFNWNVQYNHIFGALSIFFIEIAWAIYWYGKNNYIFLGTVGLIALTVILIVIICL